MEGKGETEKKCVLAAMEAQQIQAQQQHVVMVYQLLDNIMFLKVDINLLELLGKVIRI
jgi:hypothetical protein